MTIAAGLSRLKPASERYGASHRGGPVRSGYSDTSMTVTFVSGLWCNSFAFPYSVLPARNSGMTSVACPMKRFPPGALRETRRPRRRDAKRMPARRRRWRSQVADCTSARRGRCRGLPMCGREVQSLARYERKRLGPYGDAFVAALIEQSCRPRSAGGAPS
jgi:hypothetical protein